MEAAEIEDNWQQQLDELVALEAICGEDFRLSTISHLPSLTVDADLDLTPELLLGLEPPSDGNAVIEFEVLVEVELPVTSVRIMLELPSSSAAAASSSGGSAAAASSAGGSAAAAASSSSAAVSSSSAAAAAPSAGSGTGASGSGTGASADAGGGARCTMPVGEVRYLPPIAMTVKMGSRYPSQDPPSISLQAIWLTVDQVNDLLQQLLGAWTDQGPGMPICFTWVDWLKHSALLHLGLGGELVLAMEHRTVSGSEGGLRGEQVARHLMRYAATREAEAFNQGMWQCGVCFEEVVGEQCVRLPDCLHYYCTECLKQDCGIKIKEGAVESLMCPTPDCRRPLRPSTIQQLLSEADFKRWEELLLQRTLDRMQDVVYCPRCRSTVLEEPDHCAQCAKCLYVFCALCNDSWHPGMECMDAASKLQVMQNRRDRQGDATPESKERIRREADLLNQLMSIKLVNSSSRQCPQCHMAIEKTEGCNKMTCSYCRALFCYRCGKSIQGYEHFGEACRLFDPEDIEAWEQQMEAGGPFVLRPQLQVPAEFMLVQIAAGNAWARTRRCPVCGQQNLKMGQNNAMRCWACSTHFCYLCRVALRGRGAVGQHFTKSQSGQKPCKQHTDD